MTNNNYIPAHCSVEIEIEKSKREVFDHLINLSKWWPEEYDGESIKLNTEFVLRTGEAHYSKNKVIEFVPDNKLVWLTTESIRKTDAYDWTGTKFIFELRPNGNNTLLKFTYDGVVLDSESDRLKQICDITLKELFYKFVNSGNNDLSVSIEVDQFTGDVFKAITEDVANGGVAMISAAVV